MTLVDEAITIERNARIQTWIGVGGRADALAKPSSVDSVRGLIGRHAGSPVRVLGDGANLLVDDDGVDGIVISTSRLDRVDFLDDARVRAGAGANLPKLAVECARRGLAGIEGLAGVPASIGGAIRMNAGGRYGQIADVVESVAVLDIASGDVRTLERGEIEFEYRKSGLDGCVVLEAELRFEGADPGEVRGELKRVRHEKKHSQPLGARSAGCAFKNPLMNGARVAAGKLIDECGCKGMRIGGASISHEHANFVVTSPDARASDVLELLEQVAERVRDSRGVDIEREIVVWKRGDDHG